MTADRDVLGERFAAQLLAVVRERIRAERRRADAIEAKDGLLARHSLEAGRSPAAVAAEARAALLGAGFAEETLRGLGVSEASVEVVVKRARRAARTDVLPG